MFDYFYGAQAEQFSFYRVPKVLFTREQFKQLPAEAKILYGIMLDKLDLSVKNKWGDEKGRVYIIYTIEQIMEDMNCADQKATKLLDELEKKCGLIERKRQGLGKPNLIFVKNFITGVEGSRRKSAIRTYFTVIYCFKASIARAQARYPLFHSDRGFQYTGKPFCTRLKKHHMKQSMSRVPIVPTMGRWKVFGIF